MAAGGLSFGWVVGVIAGVGAAAGADVECVGEVAGSVEVMVSSANTGNVSASETWDVGLWSTSLSL